MLVLAGLCAGDRCLSPRAGRNTSWEGRGPGVQRGWPRLSLSLVL